MSRHRGRQTTAAEEGMVPAWRHVRRWSAAPVSAGLVLLLLLGAVGAGLRIPGLTVLAGLPGLGALDYRTLSAQDFLPLRGDYVNALLGTNLASGVAGPSIRAGATDPAGVSLRGPARTRSAGVSAAAGAPIEHAFTNDDFDSAVTVRQLPFSARTDTTLATREPDEPNGCARTGGTAWYRYTAKDDRPLVADSFGSDHPVSIGVFAGSHLSRLRMQGCSTSPTGDAEVTLAPKTRTTYHFQVTGVLNGGATVFRLRGLGTLTKVSDARGPADFGGAVSRDGRFVVFEEFGRVVMVDRRTGSRQLISRRTDGSEARGYYPSISGDGRYVSYSTPTAIVPEDTNGVDDLYVHDRVTGRTVRASVSSTGEQGTHWAGWPLSLTYGSLSLDGRYAAFSTPMGGLVGDETYGLRHVFVRDLRTGTTTLESRNDKGVLGNGSSGFPVISEDGRYVTFNSSSNNLARADYSAASPQGTLNVFRRDRVRKVTEIVSVTAGKADNQAFRHAASSHGTVVTWTSPSSHLVSDDSNGISDVFVRDMRTSAIQRVSVSSRGEQQLDPGGTQTDSFQIAAGGRYAAMSGDGRFVAFDSRAGNLVARDQNGVTDVFLHDRLTGSTIRVSVTTLGEEGDSDSGRPRMSHDGQVVAFDSWATRFGSSGPAKPDVFVHDRNGT